MVRVVTVVWMVRVVRVFKVVRVVRAKFYCGSQSVTKVRCRSARAANRSNTASHLSYLWSENHPSAHWTTQTLFDYWAECKISYQSDQ